MAGLIIDDAGNLISSYERPESFLSTVFTPPEPFVVAGHWVIITSLSEFYLADGTALRPVSRMWDLGPITGDAYTGPLYGDPPPPGTAGDVPLLGDSITSNWITPVDGSGGSYAGTGDQFCGEDIDYNLLTEGGTFPVGVDKVVTAYEIMGRTAPYPGSMPCYCIQTLAEGSDGILRVTSRAYHALRGETPGIKGPERLRTGGWLGSTAEQYGPMVGQVDRESIAAGQSTNMNLAHAKPFRVEDDYYPFDLIGGALIARTSDIYPYQHHQIDFYFSDLVLDPTKDTQITVTGRMPTTDVYGIALAPDDLRSAGVRANTMKPNDWENSLNYYLTTGALGPGYQPPGAEVNYSFTVGVGAEGVADEPGVAFEASWLEVTGVTVSTGAPPMRMSGFLETTGETFLVEVDPNNPDGYSSLHPECAVEGDPGYLGSRFVAPLNDGLLEAPQSQQIQDPDTGEWSWSSQAPLILHRTGRTIGEPTPFKTDPVSNASGNLQTHPTEGHLAVLTNEGWAIYIGNAVDPNYVDPDNLYAGDVPLPTLSISGGLDFVRRSFMA